MRFVLHCAALLAALGIASAGPAPAGEVVQVQISDLAFSPAEITVRAGDTVEWVNGDFIDHTATDKAGAWDVMIPAGTSARLEVAEAGAFDYYCRIHPNMTGKIRVSAD